MMSAREELVLAPAKVNLYLCVVGRRPDGYHLLDSFMVPVSLYDQITVRLGPSSHPPPHSTIVVTSDSPDASGGQTNLAYRAAATYLAHVGRTESVDVCIGKRIPVGSGLGGGSSDAAAVLLVLNRLLGSPLRVEELAALGTQIGADVAFFVHGYPARVGGVGEQVSHLALRKPLSLVLCWDRYALSTALVYSRVERSLTRPRLRSSISHFVSGRKPISEVLVNDLEAAAAQIHPEMLSLKVKLVEQGALGALMTGSGAAVFGIWPDPVSAQAAAERLRQQGLWAEAVQSLDTSPAVAR